MVVLVRLFATLRELAGTEICAVVVERGARGVDVQEVLRQRYPRLNGWLTSSRMARNLDYQPWETPLGDGDEICIIPPVSGG